MTSQDQRLRCPARALLAIDQAELSDAIVALLRQRQFTVSVAVTSALLAGALADRHPHIVVVDLDVMGAAALAACVAAEAGSGRRAVIALTRRGDLGARLTAFEGGADDILTVPFPPEEFVARVQAVMRRTYETAVAFTPVLRLGDLEIDLLNRRVRAGHHDLHLTALELSLLYLLAANAGRLITRDEILDNLWGTDYMAASNIVDRHIRNLRIKLQNHSCSRRYIATVTGHGYRFVPEPADASKLASPVAG